MQELGSIGKGTVIYKFLLAAHDPLHQEPLPVDVAFTRHQGNVVALTAQKAVTTLAIPLPEGGDGQSGR